MLEQYFVRPQTVEHIRSSWIGGAVEDYVNWLSEQKYSWKSVTRRVPLVMSFGQFAQARGAQRLDQLAFYIESFVDQWLEDRARGRRSAIERRKIADTVRNPIEQMLSLALPNFQPQGRSHKQENPFHDSAPAFYDFLRKEKGLREGSLRGYTHHLRQFATYLSSIGLTRLSDLSPTVLSAFVTELSSQIGWSSMRNACGVVRVLLRYLFRQGVLERDLSTSIEHPRLYRHSGIPRSISWDQVRLMLEVVDRRIAVGRRDYAILVLLVTYGLRGREVASLSLDDIDWRDERVRIAERKAGHFANYPLSPAVGQAILDYLRKGRPETTHRKIFLRSLAPFDPLTASAVSGCASRYLRKARIPVPRPGSHTLRHTCVQRLVDAGLSLKIIGDYVGHRSPSSTQIYAKVAIEALREVASSDGEGVL